MPSARADAYGDAIATRGAITPVDGRLRPAGN